MQEYSTPFAFGTAYGQFSSFETQTYLESGLSLSFERAFPLQGMQTLPIDGKLTHIQIEQTGIYLCTLQVSAVLLSPNSKLELWLVLQNGKRFAVTQFSSGSGPANASLLVPFQKTDSFSIQETFSGQSISIANPTIILYQIS